MRLVTTELTVVNIVLLSDGIVELLHQHAASIFEPDVRVLTLVALASAIQTLTIVAIWEMDHAAYNSCQSFANSRTEYHHCFDCILQYACCFAGAVVRLLVE